MDLSGMASADGVSASGEALIDFNNWVYSESTRLYLATFHAHVTYPHILPTGGVLPITLVDSANEGSLINKLITTNTQPFPGPISGSNFNFSVIQQGLTANCTCEYQQLDPNSDPPLVRFTNQVEIAVGDELRSYTASGMSSTCSNGDTVRAGEIGTYIQLSLLFVC
jgi:hypothetical protein